MASLAEQRDGSGAADSALGPSVEDKPHTVLGSGSSISGRLQLGSTARIDGRVDGEILTATTLVVGQTAVLTAQITVESIIVAGEINGEVIASGRIEMLPSARMRGNLTTPALLMREGALFEGHCSMPLDRPSAREALPVPEKKEPLHPVQLPEKEERQEPGSATISFFITQRQRAQLRAKGYEDATIDKMKPADAHKLLGLT